MLVFSHRIIIDQQSKAARAHTHFLHFRSQEGKEPNIKVPRTDYYWYHYYYYYGVLLCKVLGQVLRTR